jgi:cobalt-zinc-cadmium efflux system protein
MSGTRFALVTALNLAITVAEVIGGLLSGSLSLLSDALHNFSDGFSLVLSYIALKISGKNRDRKNTFGYKRAGILSALINSLLLVALSVLLVKEAIGRLLSPAEVQGWLVMVVGGISLVANLGSVLLLKKGAETSLNIRSSYLHLLSDVLASVAVVVGGLLMALYQVSWVDPVLTILVNLMILREVYALLKQSVTILMQGVPEGYDLAKIETVILEFDEVADVHHVHVWGMDENEVFLEAHINLKDDRPVSQTSGLIERITEELHEHLGIEHVTVQVEVGAHLDVGVVRNGL